ncbi:uncharacterized protein TNCV_49611 [Trichonephila clavipes]|nr:uncharacterized protein TNCV_49611 [Trichonephila clavipes]
MLSNQVTKCPLTETKTHLPNELRNKPVLLLCHHCKKHINSNKDSSPPKTYWNNLDLGLIPRQLQELCQVDIRLLTRIKPFIKIIKFDGLLGQYGFQTLENLNILREFSIDRSRVNRALNWLVAGNELFKDVVINQESRKEESDYVRGQPGIAVKEQEESEIKVHQRGNVCMHVNDVSRIIRAPWHQTDETIFTSGSAGMQSNRNRKKGRGGLAVEENGYLEILHMNVIKHDSIMYDNAFSIEYEDNTPYIGSLSDSVNDGELAHTLESSINTMFNIDHHEAGVFTAEEYS